jgi:hypothetical protein
LPCFFLLDGLKIEKRNAAAHQGRLVPVKKAKKGIWLRELSGNAQFAFLLALLCAAVSNLAVRLANVRLDNLIITKSSYKVVLNNFTT